jgi:hypothetical protein
MLLRWGNGLLYIGRNYVYDMDVCISLCWHPRADCPPLERRFHRTIEICWDWLPIFTWEYSYGPARYGETIAAAWTGRRIAMVGMRPNIFFSNLRIA